MKINTRVGSTDDHGDKIGAFIEALVANWGFEEMRVLFKPFGKINRWRKHRGLVFVFLCLCVWALRWDKVDGRSDNEITITIDS